MAIDDNAEQNWQRKERILYGGLAGLSTASLFQLIEKHNQLGVFLHASLYCFSIAIPLLVAAFLAVPSGAHARKTTQWEYVLNLVGVLASLSGFGLMFFHLDVLAGSVFVGVSILCIIFMLFGIRPNK